MAVKVPDPVWLGGAPEPSCAPYEGCVPAARAAPIGGDGSGRARPTMTAPSPPTAGCRMARTLRGRCVVCRSLPWLLPQRGAPVLALAVLLLMPCGRLAR